MQSQIEKINRHEARACSELTLSLQRLAIPQILHYWNSCQHFYANGSPHLSLNLFWKTIQSHYFLPRQEALSMLKALKSVMKENGPSAVLQPVMHLLAPFESLKEQKQYLPLVNLESLRSMIQTLSAQYIQTLQECQSRSLLKRICRSHSNFKFQSKTKNHIIYSKKQSVKQKVEPAQDIQVQIAKLQDLLEEMQSKNCKSIDSIFRKVNKQNKEPPSCKKTIVKAIGIILNQIQQRQLAESIAQVEPLKQKGAYMLHFEEALNWRPINLGQKQVDRLNAKRQNNLFSFFNLPLKSKFSFMSFNRPANLYLKKNPKECIGINRSPLQFKRPIKRNTREEIVNYCHQCKFLIDKDRLSLCSNGCGRYFCLSCRPSMDECPVCQQQCICSRCYRKQLSEKLRKIRCELSGQQESINEQTAISQGWLKRKGEQLSSLQTRKRRKVQ